MCYNCNKVSAKLYRYPVVSRAIQRDCSLVTCPCGCVTLSTIVNLSTPDFYPNVTTQPFLKKNPNKKNLFFFSVSPLSLAALIISLVTSPTKVCAFFWWLFVSESAYPFSSFHHRFPWPSPKQQLLILSKKLPTTPGKMSWKLRS